MDRSDLTMAIAGALVGAFLLGWILRWFFTRMNASGPRSIARTADMAAQLHAAEEAQRRAELHLAEAAEEGQRRIAELEAELASARDAVARADAATEDIRAAYRKALIDRNFQL
jgi:hypothetical protein